VQLGHLPEGKKSQNREVGDGGDEGDGSGRPKIAWRRENPRVKAQRTHEKESQMIFAILSLGDLGLPVVGERQSSYNI